MNRLATLIVGLVAALTLTAAPAMGDATDPKPVPGCDAATSTPCESGPQCVADPDAAFPDAEAGQHLGPCSPVQSAGDRPADRTFNQFKRSCKHEAKRWARTVFIVHELGTSANGASWWQQETRVGKWYRVYTPRGCQLRHNEWRRNHRGQVDGKAVRR